MRKPPWLPARNASCDPDPLQLHWAESSKRLCDPVGYPAPDTLLPCPPLLIASGSRSGRVLCRVQAPKEYAHSNAFNQTETTQVIRPPLQSQAVLRRMA